jgi:hypothetical protein
MCNVYPTSRHALIALTQGAVMTLELKKTSKKNSFRQTSIMIFGNAGVGKTTFASMFKSDKKLPLFLATEDGQHQVDGYVMEVGSFLEFKAAVEKLFEHREEVRKKCSCLVLDLAKDMNEMVGEAVLDVYNSKQANVKSGPHLSLGEAGDRGSAYGVKADNTIKYFRRIFAILPVVVIAHPITKEYTRADGTKEADITRADIQARVFDWLNGKCDSVAYMYPTGKPEMPTAITFKPSKKVITKTRFKNICKTYPVYHDDMEKTLAAIEADFQKK